MRTRFSPEVVVNVDVSIDPDYETYEEQERFDNEVKRSILERQQKIDNRLKEIEEKTGVVIDRSSYEALTTNSERYMAVKALDYLLTYLQKKHSDNFTKITKIAFAANKEVSLNKDGVLTLPTLTKTKQHLSASEVKNIIKAVETELTHPQLPEARVEHAQNLVLQNLISGIEQKYNIKLHISASLASKPIESKKWQQVLSKFSELLEHLQTNNLTAPIEGKKFLIINQPSFINSRGEWCLNFNDLQAKTAEQIAADFLDTKSKAAIAPDAINSEIQRLSNKFPDLKLESVCNSQLFTQLLPDRKKFVFKIMDILAGKLQPLTQEGLLQGIIFTNNTNYVKNGRVEIPISWILNLDNQPEPVLNNILDAWQQRIRVALEKEVKTLPADKINVAPKEEVSEQGIQEAAGSAAATADLGTVKVDEPDSPKAELANDKEDLGFIGVESNLLSEAETEQLLGQVEVVAAEELEITNRLSMIRSFQEMSERILAESDLYQEYVSFLEDHDANHANKDLVKKVGKARKVQVQVKKRQYIITVAQELQTQLDRLDEVKELVQLVDEAAKGTSLGVQRGQRMFSLWEKYREDILSTDEVSGESKELSIQEGETGLHADVWEILQQEPAFDPESKEWFEHKRDREVKVVGDLHGSYLGFVENLKSLGVILEIKGKLQWKGENRKVVLLGDILADRNPEGLKILTGVRVLQEQAQGQGGEISVLAGNHDDWFLGFLQNSDADEAIQNARGGMFGGEWDWNGKSSNPQGLGMLIELARFGTGPLKELTAEKFKDAKPEDRAAYWNMLLEQQDAIVKHLRESPEGRAILISLSNLKIMEVVDDQLFLHTNPTRTMVEDLSKAKDIRAFVSEINADYQSVLKSSLFEGELVNSHFKAFRDYWLNTDNRDTVGITDETSTEEARVILKDAEPMVENISQQGIQVVWYGHSNMGGKARMHTGGVDFIGVDRGAFKRANDDGSRSVGSVDKQGVVTAGEDKVQVRELSDSYRENPIVIFKSRIDRLEDEKKSLQKLWEERSDKTYAQATKEIKSLIAELGKDASDVDLLIATVESDTPIQLSSDQKHILVPNWLKEFFTIDVKFGALQEELHGVDEMYSENKSIDNVLPALNQFKAHLEQLEEAVSLI